MKNRISVFAQASLLSLCALMVAPSVSATAKTRTWEPPVKQRVMRLAESDVSFKFRTALGDAYFLVNIAMSLINEKPVEAYKIIKASKELPKIVSIVKSCKANEFKGARFESTDAAVICDFLENWHERTKPILAEYLTDYIQKEANIINKLLKDSMDSNRMESGVIVRAFSDERLRERLNKSTTFKNASTIVNGAFDVEKELKKHNGFTAEAKKLFTERMLAQPTVKIKNNASRKDEKIFRKFNKEFSGLQLKIKKLEKVKGWELQTDSLKRPTGRTKHYKMLVSPKETPFCLVVDAWIYYDYKGRKYVKKGQANNGKTVSIQPCK